MRYIILIFISYICFSFVFGNDSVAQKRDLFGNEVVMPICANNKAQDMSMLPNFVNQLINAAEIENISFKQCDSIFSFFATSANNEIFILYNPSFYLNKNLDFHKEKLSELSANEYFVLFCLAHEVGHIVSQHVGNLQLVQKVGVKKIELEADAFAAKTMLKIGIGLPDLEVIIENIFKNQNDHLGVSLVEKKQNVITAFKDAENKYRFINNSVDPVPVVDSSAIYFAAAYQMYNSDNLKIAEEYLTRALKFNSDDENVLELLIQIYFDGNKFSKAIELVNHLIVVNPSSSNAYYLRGKTLLQLNSFKDAIADFTKALDLDKKNKYAYLQRALAYEKINDLDKSLEDLNSSIELDIDFSDGYFYRARIYYKKGQYDFACRNYLKAKKLGSPKIITELNQMCRYE